MTLPKTNIRSSITSRGFSIGLLVIGWFLLLSDTSIVGQNQFRPSAQLTEPAIERTGTEPPSPGSGSFFSQLPIPAVPHQIDDPKNRFSGRTTAVIQETADTPTQQRNRETPDPLATIDLKTRPLSPNIVEASRRAINGSNQYSSTSTQNASAQNASTPKLNSGSGWSPDRNQGSSVQSHTRPFPTSQNSNGQKPSNLAVAYSKNQPTVSSPVRRASMSTDIERFDNSISRNSAQMDVGVPNLLNVDQQLVGNENLVSGTATTARENKQATGTILPTEKSNEKKTETRQKLNLSDTIQKVAVSTIVILVLCVAAMVILKKMGYTGPVNKKKAELEFDVIETKKISGKCQLKLVTIRNHKVIVGIDQSGIKSMVCLPPSFAEEYDEANAAETALEDAGSESNAGTESNAVSIKLTESSSIAELLATNATDLYESERKTPTNELAAMPNSLNDENQEVDSNLAARSPTTAESETPLNESIRSKRRRPPIRRFHSYEIAGGGNFGE